MTSAFQPMAVLRAPLLLSRARYPCAVLSGPLSKRLDSRAKMPVPVFWLPRRLPSSAPVPTAVLDRPSVSFWRVPVPSAVLSLPSVRRKRALVPPAVLPPGYPPPGGGFPACAIDESVREIRNARIASETPGKVARLIQFPKSVVFICLIQIAVFRD